jgi:hypothetical protein
MKKLTATLAAILFAACAPTEKDDAQEFRDALPKAQTAALGTYQTEGGTSGKIGVSRDALGDTDMQQSEYAVMSYFLALSVNGGAALVLDLVQFITAFPPSVCEPGVSCTWGPWVGDQGLNRYRLDVTKVGDAYEYALSGQNAVVADSPFVDILTGTAYPVDRDHGSGTFTLDFQASHEGLAHGPAYEQKDFGQLVLDYDNVSNPVTVSAQFIGARNQDPDPAKQHFMNAAYGFEDAASGGQLQVAFENLDTTETLAMRTRWSASGQGRADVLFTAAGGATFTASECWAGRTQDFVEVYDTKHLDIPELSNPSACSPFTAFEQATIELPSAPE